ncbi:MAG: spore germination protein [Butyrivibrio sp.]
MSLISSNIKESSRAFSAIVGPERNFDIINKRMVIGGRLAEFFMIDGFVKDEIMEKLFESFSAIQEADMPKTAEEFINTVPYNEVSIQKSYENASEDLLKGMTCMFVEGYPCAIMIDCRSYPSRSVSEPWKNRSLRGSRDGFVETIVSNVALLRRRIRTPDFCTLACKVGTMSNTDVVFAYIQGKADEKLLNSLMDRLKKSTVEAATMNIESLAEVLLPGAYINPFPKFKYSERPDSAAAAIFDGNIVVLVDNSPAVLIVPTSIFDVMEEADDFYFPPLTGTYIKWSRYLMTIASLIITPLWIMFLKNPSWLPASLQFVLIEEGGSTVPVIWQLLILEFAIDGLRLAAVNTPTLLSTPLSVIAGIVVGEYAVSSGWFDSECMLYMAFVTMGTYTQTSYEIGYAIKFFRIILLVLTWFFGLWGFIGGLVLLVLTISFNRTISQKSYIYPVIPFNWNMLKRKIFRIRLGKEK